MGDSLAATSASGVAAEKWYFAYGSNMLADVFISRRKISPLRSEVASIKGHTLCFNIMSIPYVDPAMGGIRRVEGKVDREAQGLVADSVFGVAYLLTSEDLRRVIVTEGGGIAYTIITLEATIQKDGAKVPVVTLIGRHCVSPSYERLPSERYMGLLIRGAQEQSLPEFYQKRLAAQPTYKPLDTPWYNLGRWLFLAFWTRVGRMIEKGVRISQGVDGHVPGWFLFGFDGLLWFMWGYHDYIHSKIWGRGDGW